MSELSGPVIELHDRVASLIGQQCEPNVEEAHNLINDAFASLVARMATLSIHEREVVQYCFYEEMLLKVAETHTVIDLLSSTIPSTAEELAAQVEHHMESMLS